jgi:hypothetical protein
VKTFVLDRSDESTIAGGIVDAVDELGYSENPEQAIPGLIFAIILLADKCDDPEQALSEAIDLLADAED